MFIGLVGLTEINDSIFENLIELGIGVFSVGNMRGIVMDSNMMLFWLGWNIMILQLIHFLLLGFFSFLRKFEGFEFIWNSG